MVGHSDYFSCSKEGFARLGRYYQSHAVNSRSHFQKQSFDSALIHMKGEMHQNSIMQDEKEPKTEWAESKEE